jgi:hypothetical protein
LSRGEWEAARTDLSYVLFGDPGLVIQYPTFGSVTVGIAEILRIAKEASMGDPDSCSFENILSFDHDAAGQHGSR